MEYEEMEEQQVCKINKKNYVVTIRTSKDCLKKEELSKLIYQYALNELKYK